MLTHIKSLSYDVGLQLIDALASRHIISNSLAIPSLFVIVLGVLFVLGGSASKKAIAFIISLLYSIKRHYCCQLKKARDETLVK